MDFAQDFTSFWEQSQAEVIAWRRHLHEHPELSFQEVNTSNYVYHLLCSLPELEVSRPTAIRKSQGLLWKKSRRMKRIIYLPTMIF